MESKKYGDIILGDYDEDDISSVISLKTGMLLEWAYKYCNFRYLLKTFDDTFVNLKNLFDLFAGNITITPYFTKYKF